MNKKTMKKIINILCIFMLCLLMFSPYLQASSTEGNDWWEDGKNFIESGQKGDKINEGQIQEALLPIGRTLVTIATIVITVVTIVMGIKYMIHTDPNEKAKLKTQLIGLVVSAIVIYGAQIIWALVYKTMVDITG